MSWGDCDSAQIVYTGTIPGFGLRAIEAWLEACVGYGFYTMNLDLGVGTPFVRLACEFVSPITPRERLDMQLTVTRVGARALHTHVRGAQGERDCFHGDYVCVFVDAVAHKSIPIPDNMRRNIVAFARRQGSAFDDDAAHV